MEFGARRLTTHRVASLVCGLPLPSLSETHLEPRHLHHVKSGSSGLKSDGGNSREIEVSYRGGPEVRWRYESGDLVRTWHRLMCHALAEVVVLDFKGMEVQRYGGELKQPNKPVYRALGNPTRGKVTSQK